MVLNFSEQTKIFPAINNVNSIASLAEATSATNPVKVSVAISPVGAVQPWKVIVDDKINLGYTET